MATVAFARLQVFKQANGRKEKKMTILATAKSASEVKLKGIKVEFITVDKCLRGIVFSDGKNSVTIQRKDAYSDQVAALVPQPYETVDRYSLSGTFGSLVPISEYFEHEYEATERKRAYEAEASSSELTITKTAVFINESGEVRGNASGDTQTAREMEDDGMPF
jgi:hypothetical protein